ncbi:MAG: sigma 54-interacting transcriptional regulator [Firmicutes bacterium]|nr:sigma 54-interacting transcriptional regulator [Bacillota bacterium]
MDDDRVLEEQQEQSAWLRALVDAVDVGVHAVDARGLTIFYNERAGALDGLAPGEVIGKHVLEVFPSLTSETSSLLRVLRSQETISHRRQVYKNYRGQEVHTTNTTRPVYSGSRLLGALEVAADITEVQHLAERVVDLQAAALPGKPGDSAVQGMVAGARQGSRTGSASVRWSLDDIVTASPAVRDVIERARKVARTSSPVLVYGETGVGKELLVQGLHAASPRSRKPFIAQNCAALPGPLLEGILFGTVKGSFTGAENRPGLFELADGGTLFLDELNSLPLDLQAKLLRVLEDGQVRRLGASHVVPVDVRIMAAMNAAPEDVVLQGLLREDLYYRVRVVSLRMPSLAERPEDVSVLARHFLAACNQRFGTRIRAIGSDAMDVLHSATWRGNVRELKHVIEAAINEVEGDVIHAADLPPHVKPARSAGGAGGLRAGSGASGASGGATVPGGTPGEALPERLMNAERHWISEALTQTEGNIARAAAILGIPRQTLQSKLKKFDM